MSTLSNIHVAFKNAESRGDLIHCLLALDARERRRECGPILCELHNTGDISLVSNQNLQAVSNLKHNDFWSVVHTLNEAIPDLNCSHIDVLKLVQTLVEKAGSDSAAGISLVKWCSANPEKAKLIVTGAKALDQSCLAHAVFALQGLGEPKLAFELLGHPKAAVVAVGLRSLGRLKLNDKISGRSVIDECFKVLVNLSDEDVRASSIEAAFKTWEQTGKSDPYRQTEFISAVANGNEDKEITLLTAMLFYHPKGLVSESINLILEAAKSENLDPEVILNSLDQALHAKDERWALTKVMDVFAAQIPRMPKSTEAREYYHFCTWTWEDQKNASQLFATWFTEGQSALCSFLADMVGAGGAKGKPVEIFKSDLPSEAIDQVFMARKCVGFLWFHEVTAASILLSIVKNGKLAAREEVEKLLFNPLLLSYGGELRDFLAKQSTNASKRVSQCAQRLIAKHDTYISGLEQTDKIVELLPTIEQRRAAAMKDRERNKDIQKQANKRSIFADIVSHSTLLYGKQSFTLIHGAGDKKTPSITPLAEISYSTELPRLSVVDPVGFHETLTVFQFEQRIKK